jgi:molybdopterin synthase catalytic subunit
VADDVTAHGTTLPYASIVSDRIDLAAVSALVEHSSIGAVSLFVGTVREHNEGRAVTGIDYEAYQPMAERELRALATELMAELPGLRLAIVHRVGTLLVGEASVVIAAAHARRAPAMLGAQRAIESLKQRVPIWKREHYVDGERRWIDPTVPSSAGVA